MRALSVGCLLAPVAASLIWPEGDVIPETVVYSVLAASLLLVMQPVADEGLAPWVVFSGVILMVELLFFVLGFNPSLYVASCLFVVLAYDLFCFMERCSVLRKLFEPRAVWHSLESHSRMLFSLCAGIGALLLWALEKVAWACVPIAVLATGFYIIMYYRSVSGHCLVMSFNMERVVKQMIRSASDISSEAARGEDSDEREKMQAIFGRILRIMEKDRPFLDSEYTLQDLASSAFTNKTYISKTINTITGKNFRQFVNGYRIHYAVELLDGNPRLTVGQLADRSGFNSSVTFSMAFKLNMGETPGEYSIRRRSGLV